MTEQSSLRWPNSPTDHRKSNLKWLGLSLIAFVLVLAADMAQAQKPGKVPRIGYLSSTSPSGITDRTEAFRQGLRELVYVEGESIIIEWRNGDGSRTRANELAEELVRLKLNITVTASGGSTRVAKQATSTIPIVMKQDSDPVGNGFVAGLARPGGNITGLSRLAPELSGKQLEVLKDAVPRVDRVAVFGTSKSTGHAQRLNEVELAAMAFSLQLQYIDVPSPRTRIQLFNPRSRGRQMQV